MAQLDDLEFRITASTDLLRADLNRGNAAIQQFATQNTRHINELGNRFEEVSRKLRQVFSFIGVSVGIEAFKKWIEDATNVNKLTDDQYQKLQGLKSAMAQLGESTDAVAQSIATRLAPALETAAKFWAELLRAPTSGERADTAISSLNSQILNLQKLNDQQTGSQADEFIAARQKIIDRLIAQREQLTKVTDKPQDLRFGNLEGFEVGTSSTENGLPAEIQKLVVPKFDFDQATIDLEKQMQEFVDHAKLPDFKFPEINLENFKDGLDEMEKMTHSFAKEFGQGLHNSLVSFILDGQHRFSDFLKQLAAEVAVSGLFNLISGGLAGSTGGVGQFFSQVFGGARASGGPVSAGVPYLVGERGPEMFVPNISGRISANGSGSPNIQVVQHFNVDAIEPTLETQLSLITRLAASSAYEGVMQSLSGIR
jgi:hypothetical protein